MLELNATRRQCSAHWSVRDWNFAERLMTTPIKAKAAKKRLFSNNPTSLPNRSDRGAQEGTGADRSAPVRQASLSRGPHVHCDGQAVTGPAQGLQRRVPDQGRAPQLARPGAVRLLEGGTGDLVQAAVGVQG